MLDQITGSKLRAKVLGWLLTHPGEKYFVRQLTGLLKDDSTNLSRELARLARLGILSCKVEGRQKYYQANTQCPVYDELRGLAVKTAGLGDYLRSALLPVTDKIHVAFIFGSFASGKETPSSDIDVFLAGDVSPRQVYSLLGRAGRAVGRELNPIVHTPIEFRRKVKKREHFVTELLKEKKIFLVGTEDDLKRLAR